MDPLRAADTIYVLRSEHPQVQLTYASRFPQKVDKLKLRKVVKTRKRWMFSWLTGSGRLKEDVMKQMDPTQQPYSEELTMGKITFKAWDLGGHEAIGRVGRVAHLALRRRCGASPA